MIQASSGQALTLLVSVAKARVLAKSVMERMYVIGVDKQPISFALGMKMLQEFHLLDNKIYSRDERLIP